MKKFILSLLQDELGAVSSKRVVGIMCAITLCVGMGHNVFFPSAIQLNSTLIESVALLAFGCLGLSSIDKFTATTKQIQEVVEKTS